MSDKLLNIDLDGVLYPWHEAFTEFAEERIGPVPPIMHWNFYEDWGLSEGAFKNLFRRGVEYADLWDQDRPPPEGAIETLWSLSDRGFYIRILTHRLAHKFGHKLAIKQTVSWLDRYSIPYRSIAVIGPEPKTNYPAAWLVDDSPTNLFLWQKKYGSSIRFHRPWNEHCGPDFGTRALDWDDVEAIVCG